MPVIVVVFPVVVITPIVSDVDDLPMLENIEWVVEVGKLALAESICYPIYTYIVSITVIVPNNLTKGFKYLTGSSFTPLLISNEKEDYVKCSWFLTWSIPVLVFYFCPRHLLNHKRFIFLQFYIKTILKFDRKLLLNHGLFDQHSL